jgi:ectoine hydroxylase-related dioxygenase (phytanoyl-CoA dioxygenase family)
VAKLDTNENNVFLHQDSSYHFGSDQKYSIFIPLTDCRIDNGGLIFIPGSHKFGFMGDAGALNDIYPEGLTLVSPELSVGDLLVMNSHMWHKSRTNVSGEPRIYFDIHIMDSLAPFSKRTLIGNDPSDYSIKNYDNDVIFANSRYQRLRFKN